MKTHFKELLRTGSCRISGHVNLIKESDLRFTFGWGKKKIGQLDKEPFLLVHRVLCFLENAQLCATVCFLGRLNTSQIRPTHKISKVRRVGEA